MRRMILLLALVVMVSVMVVLIASSAMAQVTGCEKFAEHALPALIENPGSPKVGTLPPCQIPG